MKKYYFLLLPLLAVIYSSCSKLDGSEGVPQDPLQAIMLQDTLTMYTGNIIKLHVSVSPATYDLKSLIWNSSDTSIISVDSAGTIVAKNEGTSKVSVSNAGKTVTVSCLVSVKDSLGVGLVAYYPFSNSAQDSSGNHNDGTAFDVASSADRFGNPNAAYTFNGTSSYILVKDSRKLRLSGTDFSINYWVNLNNYSSSNGTTVLSKRGLGLGNGWITGVGGYGNVASIVGKYGTVTYNVSGGTDPFAYGLMVVPIKSWHMISVLYDYDASIATIYIDGVFDRNTDRIPSPNGETDSDMYIGADSQGNSNPSYHDYLTNGGVDDIRIYNRKITAQEVHKLYVAKK